jgi:hypothetical protein
MTMGIVREKINILTPASSDAQIAAIPVSDTEQAGMGAAVGKVIGGSMGAAGGFGAGAALASLILPGVGPILAGGLIGAGLLGLGGAAGGSAAGEALEDTISGIPRDEIYVYEDALRQGKTVVVADADDERHADAVRRGFEESGAESIDAARDHWWIGLRSSEKELYTEGDFEEDEPYYRRGFEAAQSPVVRGKSYAEAQGYLTKRYEIAASNSAFRRGYERGSAHWRKISASQN